MGMPICKQLFPPRKCKSIIALLSVEIGDQRLVYKHVRYLLTYGVQLLVSTLSTQYTVHSKRWAQLFLFFIFHTKLFCP